MWLLGPRLLALPDRADRDRPSFVVLFLHEHRGLSTHAAGAVLAVIYVLAVGARIGAGRSPTGSAARIAPLRTIGVALALLTAAVAAATDAPLALLVPLFVVAGVLGLSWNGLSFTAAAETAGAARSGAALGFQQTMLGVVARRAARVRRLRRDDIWRIAFASPPPVPPLGVLILRRLPEPASETRANTRNVGDPAGSSLNSGLRQPSSLVALRERRLHRRLAHRQRAAQRSHGAESLTCRSAAASISRSISTSNTFCMQPMYVCPCSSYA